MDGGTLNQFLQPTNAPITDHVHPANSFFFNNVAGRNSITTNKIKNFSFSKGQGGTLTLGGNLGGTNNANGVLSVQNTNGTEVVRLDNTGITVTNGSISIQNTGGTSIIDATGLVSTNNFVNGEVTQSSTQTTSSSSYGDVSGGSVTFSLSRTTNVFVTIDATGRENSLSGAGGACVVTLSVDGTDQSKSMSFPGAMSPDGLSAKYSTTSSIAFLLSLGSGSHTLKLRFKSTNSTSASIFFATLTYVVLGS